MWTSSGFELGTDRNQIDQATPCLSEVIYTASMHDYPSSKRALVERTGEEKIGQF